MKIRLRCHVCDRPIADEQDYDSHDDHDSSLCWKLLDNVCFGTPVDWRQRAILAEAKLRVIEKTLKLTN